MRFISAQLNTYIKKDLWIKNAKHSNLMAKDLSKKLSEIKDIQLTYPTQSNEIFVKLPKKIIDHLNNNGYSAIKDDLFDGSVRFVTAWNTEIKDIDKLISVIKHKI